MAVRALHPLRACLRVELLPAVAAAVVAAVAERHAGLEEEVRAR
jgi:hypothetical protein